MTFEPVLNLGTLIHLVTLVGAIVAGWVAVSRRLGAFEMTLTYHADALMKQSERMDRHEERILAVIGDLHRVLGRMEHRHDDVE